jgi:hypothetical protein
LRAMGAEYGLSKDTLYRHAARHLPEEPEEDKARQVGDLDEGKKEPDEARQMAEVVEQKKEPDDEARYQAFIERFKGRGFVWRADMVGWPYQLEELDELIDTAKGRGDLLNVGRLYCPSVQAVNRFRAAGA